MSSGFPTFSAVIPAFNEAGRITRAVLDTKRVLGNEAPIIVVDDGSVDSTADEARVAGATVIRHAINRGKGAAVRTGALASTSEWILVLDADLSTQPSELERFRNAFDESDIIFGSRRISGASIIKQQPWYRVKAGQLFNWMMRATSGLPYHDTQCGFKAYRMSACRPLFELQVTDGWSFDAELLMRAKQAGLRLAERAVVWSHAAGSKVRITDAPVILFDLWRLRRVIPECSLDATPKN
jgi:glycosyltransferase involved in cell wall biosynthesis